MDLSQTHKKDCVPMYVSLRHNFVKLSVHFISSILLPYQVLFFSDKLQWIPRSKDQTGEVSSYNEMWLAYSVNFGFIIYSTYSSNHCLAAMQVNIKKYMKFLVPAIRVWILMGWCSFKNLLWLNKKQQLNGVCFIRISNICGKWNIVHMAPNKTD